MKLRRLPIAVLLVVAGSAAFLATCRSGRWTVQQGVDAEFVAPDGPMRLRLVTFNVHDLFVADRRRERMRAIGRELGRRAPDYVALQEAFSKDHRRELGAELERVSGIPYHTLYFPSGVAGSGLFVASRHKIERAAFRRYAKNGRWHQFKHGDWWAGKGVAMVRVRVEGPDGAVAHVDVFNTHAIANYIDASYQEDRLDQMRELAEFVAAEATLPTPTFVLGDLNCRPGEPEFERGTAGLRDLIAAAGGGDGRIDHILVRDAAGYRVSAGTLTPLNTGTDDDGNEIDLSDHTGYVIDVTIAPGR